MSMTTGYGMGAPTGRVSGHRAVNLPRLTPEQMGLLGTGLRGAQPGYEKALELFSSLAGGDQSRFAELEAPALREFSALQGNLASRFSGGGGGPGALSARRSSGFGLAASSQAQELAEKLQSQRLGLQLGASQQLMQLVESLLGKQPYDQYFMPKKQPMWQRLLGGGLPVLGGIAGGIFGGPAGAMLGSQIGGYAGKSFL